MRIDLRSLSYRIGRSTILDDVSLSVPSGSRLALMGYSGSGKSTLVRLIAGFAAPSAGTVMLDGVDTARRGGRVAPAHERGIAYVPQDGALFPHLDATANIGFGLPRGERADAARRWADVVELDPALLTRRPHELSGGQQQRVALARALAVRSRAVVLDEPFSALDVGLRAAARRNVVDALDETGATAVLVTHDQDEALSFGDLLGVVDAGRLVQLGSPDDVFDLPADERVARLLGDAVVLAGTSDGRVASTTLGDIALRGRGGAVPVGAVRVLVRPAQLALHEGDGNAVVVDAAREGAWQRTTVQTPAPGSGSGVRLTVSTPVALAARIEPGARVHVRVAGTAAVLAG